ncbi:hypothetical protein ABMA70_02625 [Halobacteriovorax sp. XZX-3]|uniref:hypothetical protein n=1 Tax=unclassified Halobacteriovorax TaxID=2639665 RepID=UPI000CD2ED13|nr:hypothetical protein C0Z22_05940 [Halobacteriovorax sp. DA5]
MLFALSFTLNAKEYTRPIDYAEYTVEINAPIEAVWDYNSKNEHARQWSTYFYKIVSCPNSQCPWNEKLKQSDIGFTRRCYRRESEQGTFWDETTTMVSKSENEYYKQIRAYNFNEFMDFMNYNEKGEFLVEQFYKKLGDNKTSLTFRSGYIRRHELASAPSKFEFFLWEQIFHFITKRSVTNTFKWNLENIKAHIEQGENYKRIHPYSSNDADFY